MQERRKAQRWKSYLGGKVSFNSRLSTVDCTIRNISPSGVMLSFDNTAFVPDEFDLHIPKREQTFRARMKWRRPGEVGVEFDSVSREEAGTALDQELRIRQLQRGNAALRRHIQTHEQGI